MPISVTPAIPASQIVNVIPSVLAAGGDALDLVGLILTTDIHPPIGEVLSFADAADVTDYFGGLTQEDALGTIYFNGPDNATAQPGALLVAQYPLVAVSGYLRGGDISGMALADLQALPVEAFHITIAGADQPTSTINLSTATSFSSAAIIIAGRTGWDGPQDGTATVAITGTTMTVSSVASGTIGVGDHVQGTGFTGQVFITAQLTGTGGVGTYTITPSQPGTSPATSRDIYKPSCYYDSVSGALVLQTPGTGVTATIGFATGSGAGTIQDSLKFTAATGAVLSQGADAAVPGTFMDALIARTQNWASFMTTWEPVTADKEGFATWTNAQRNRFVYEMWDTDVANIATGSGSAAVAFVNAGALSGISMIYEDPSVDTVGGELAAFEMGWTASLDFTRLNGRQTAAFKRQSGLAPQIFDGTAASNLIAKGMNFFGDYTTPNEAFRWYYPGSISGEFVWKDSYVNQIWLNAALQLAIMVGLDNSPSIPYNSDGYTQIESFVMDPINAGVRFGAIVAGVALSAAQKTEVNRAAGLTIDTILFQRGWYFQVSPATAAIRRARTSPSCTLWYCDGGSIQKITLASIEIQ
jgi:hypothetical protein